MRCGAAASGGAVPPDQPHVTDNSQGNAATRLTCGSYSAIDLQYRLPFRSLVKGMLNSVSIRQNS